MALGEAAGYRGVVRWSGSQRQPGRTVLAPKNEPRNLDSDVIWT